MKKGVKDRFFQLLWIIIVAFVILFIFTAWFTPSLIKTRYENVKDIFKTDESEKESNLVLVDGKELKLGNPDFFMDRFNGISYDGMVYEEDENSDFLVISFTDNSGYLNEKCFELIRRTPINDFYICQECSNKTQGKIYCSMYDYFHNPQEGFLLALFNAEGGGYKQPITNFELEKETLMNMVLENAKTKCNNGIEQYCQMVEDAEN